ncbi:Abi-alpha family protein [Mycolicibacterium mucogenicum]|uniref:Abi-alpha family protein n=1 Tax=Mycolicibacterium mucogenicum TaxID=56689 RepID=UPI002269B0E2|nr:Abi-alpha family protein [Mycolicibacterium mucogenicum]MCX8562944.1 Abi-alpha family protein [Mycolicibacterium mucogenicum]
MSDDPNSDDRGREQSSNPLGAIVDPLTKLGIDTARDIAAAVQSTRAAAGDLLKVVNILSRLPGRESHPSPAAISDDIDDDDENATAATAVLPVVAPDESPVENSGIFGGLKRAVTPVRKKSDHRDEDKKGAKHDSDADLRRWGDELIAKSQKPTRKQAHRHPAFEQILNELAPDEVRMLRFLAVAGTQPSIDIRTKTMFQVGSERLVSGVNMIADMAGCRWPEADRRYLANLNRLGLVRFSSEPVADYRRYALLEVQPRALEVTEVIPKTISVYRSIYLSEFGKQFCEVCIDTDGYNAGGWATDERGDKIIGKGPPDPARKHKH